MFHKALKLGIAGGMAILLAANGYAKGFATLPTVPLSALPAEAREVLSSIKRGEPFAYARDGVVFGNYERQLPIERRGYYHEYTVPTPGARNRGARRLIVGGTPPARVDYFYTGDHYNSFQKIQDE